MLFCHFVDKWYLSKGVLLPSYILTIFGSTVTIFYNILLVSDMGGRHKSVILFIITSVWAISMAIKGIHRLYKEGKLKRLPSVSIKTSTIDI